MIKALFFDIDGTLVSFRTHMIPPKVLQALKQLRDKGCLMFISSGRHRISMDNLSGLEFDGYVTVNGAMCIVPGSSADSISLCGHSYDMVYLRELEKEDVSRHLDFCEGAGLSCAPICLDSIGINKVSPAAEEVFSLIRFATPPVCDIRKMTDSSPVCQLISFVPQDMEMQALSGMPSSHAARWHPAFVDIVHKDVNKREGVRKMLGHFGIAPDECLAFGDGGNDIEMLDFIPGSVAMGNASDEVKAHASFVTEHIDNDGVLVALRHFGLL